MSDLFDYEEILPEYANEKLKKLLHEGSQSDLFNPVSKAQTLTQIGDAGSLEHISQTLEPRNKFQFSVYVSSTNRWFFFKAKKKFSELHLVFLHNEFLARLCPPQGSAKIEYFPET